MTDACATEKECLGAGGAVSNECIILGAAPVNVTEGGALVQYHDGIFDTCRRSRYWSSTLYMGISGVAVYIDYNVGSVYYTAGEVANVYGAWCVVGAEKQR
jgi:hypothetical protein